uniref:antibiotic biosynthesis monooxygenase family protein n=1 Tax=Thaumasiovibrio occultus TaxID=1891184 RepID=UPI00192D000E|nr:antibiotic biosynthesis monooxygenase [Thaumasiovibrio occultus]
MGITHVLNLPVWVEDWAFRSQSSMSLGDLTGKILRAARVWLTLRWVWAVVSKSRLAVYPHNGESMFVALYEFKVKPGKTEAFRQHWLETTKGIYQEFGSKGSRLHSTNDPLVYVGYAQWPDRQAWAEEKRFRNQKFATEREKMWGCLESSYTIYEMEVTDDYLQPTPYS